MAKESMKAREVKRAKLVEKYAAKRAKLKEEGDYIGLSLLPKNSSRVRLHNTKNFIQELLSFIIYAHILAYFGTDFNSKA